MSNNVSFGEKENVTKTAQLVLTANTFQSVHDIPFQIKNRAKIIIPLKTLQLSNLLLSYFVNEESFYKESSCCVTGKGVHLLFTLRIQS